MEKLMEFWNTYGNLVINVLITGGLSIVVFVINKIVKKTTNKFINLSMGVVSKLFGGSTDIGEIDKTIKALPFVKKLEEYADSINTDLEIKLVELKRKLVSPKLTKIERLSFEFEFEKIYKKLEYSLSKETIDMLRKLEEIAKEG